MSVRQQHVKTDRVIRYAVAQAANAATAVNAVLEWQAASGIAHGRRWARNLMLNSVDGARQVELSQIKLLCDKVLNLAEAAAARYEELNTVSDDHSA